MSAESLPLLLGLSDKAGSGKSTVAEYLCRVHGYHEFALAGALKEVVGLAFDFSPDQLYGDLKEVVDERWGVTPRWCLQWLGTEVLKARWPEIWIRHLRQEILDFLAGNGQRRIVVSDVRFIDEAAALRKMGARLIRIERPSWGWSAKGLQLHVSETELDGWAEWDETILNEGSLSELFQKVDLLLNA